MQDVLNLAQDIAARLGYIDGVEAVSLVGSWATDEMRLDADVNLSIYYLDVNRPSIRALQELAMELNGSHDPQSVGSFWDNGSVQPGGAWLYVEGRRVEWIYRDLEQVSHAIENARSGTFTASYEAGFPHGFFSHYLVGEIHESHILFDPTGAIGFLRTQVSTYPEPLREAIITSFMREADLTLYAAQRAASENDVFMAAGHIYRCVACLLQVLCADNRRYITNEGHAMYIADTLPARPARLKQNLVRILGKPGTKSTDLLETIDRLRSLLSETQLKFIHE